MTAVAYAMSDVQSVRVSEQHGGCGEQHEVRDDGNGYKVVSCDQCAPYLTGSHASFAGVPEGVPSTPDEMAHREYLKREAETSNAALDVQIRREFARSRMPEAPANAGDYVASLSPKERRELAAMLAKELDGDDEHKAPHRGPGRPRTAAK